MAMTERKFSVKVMKGIQGPFPGALVVKTADRATRGIPDIFASALEHTFWIENKYLRKGKRLKDIVKFDQLMFCHQLASTTGKCWITIFEDNPVQTTVWLPRTLISLVFPSVLFGNPQPTHLVSDQLGDDNLVMLLNNYGSICIPEQHYTAIGGRLMKDYLRAQRH